MREQEFFQKSERESITKNRASRKRKKPQRQEKEMQKRNIIIINQGFMSYINIFFLIIFAAVMIRGFFRGLIKEALSLGGLFIAFFGSGYAVYILTGTSGYDYIKVFHNETITKILIFIAFFVVIMVFFCRNICIINQIFEINQSRLA